MSGPLEVLLGVLLVVLEISILLLIWIGPAWLIARYARRKGYSFGWFLALGLLTWIVSQVLVWGAGGGVFIRVPVALFIWIVPLTIVLILDDRRTGGYGPPAAPVAGAGYMPGYPSGPGYPGAGRPGYPSGPGYPGAGRPGYPSGPGYPGAGRPGYPDAMSPPQPWSPTPGAPPPGWYPSPDGVMARWWDGSAWTDHRRALSEFHDARPGGAPSGQPVPGRGPRDRLPWH